jgi:co-chaperonin GroES (HSP10)
MSENRANELGKADSGHDFAKDNVHTVSVGGEPLEVNLSGNGSEDVQLTPVKFKDAKQSKPFELQHSTHDILMAQLVEEPQPEAFIIPVIGTAWGFNSRLARVMGRNRNREELVWYGVRPNLMMAALDMPPNANGRLIVKQDTQESEYACQACKGKGHTEEVCSVCDGQGCQECTVLGFEREAKHPCGKTPCRACKGTGWRGGIVIPEQSQSRPVTGIVVSVGPSCLVVKLGDRVLHSRYAGHQITTPEGDGFTMMRESEILSLIKEVPNTAGKEWGC